MKFYKISLEYYTLLNINIIIKIIEKKIQMSTFLISSEHSGHLASGPCQSPQAKAEGPLALGKRSVHSACCPHSLWAPGHGGSQGLRFVIIAVSPFLFLLTVCLCPSSSSKGKGQDGDTRSQLPLRLLVFHLIPSSTACKMAIFTHPW